MKRNPILLVALITILLNNSQLYSWEEDLKVYPIIDLSYNCLLGGTDKTNWVDDSTALFSVNKIKIYKAYSLSGYKGEARLYDTLIERGMADQNFYVDSISMPDSDERMIATGGDWEAMPRIPKAMKATKEQILIAANFLKEKGIKKPKVKITQVYEIDLDKDGTIETIMVSESYKNKNNVDVSAGDYSFVLLITKKGEITEKALLSGDFYPKYEDGAIQNFHIISNILDLNGDGIMEILINSSYYEGDADYIFEYKNGSAKSVIEVYRGL